MPLPGRLKILPGVLFAFGVIIAILPHGVLSSYHTDTATRVGIYFIAILSLNLVLGYCGQISLGQGALMSSAPTRRRFSTPGTGGRSSRRCPSRSSSRSSSGRCSACPPCVSEAST
jgi:hypothetical protein